MRSLFNVKIIPLVPGSMPGEAARWFTSRETGQVPESVKKRSFYTDAVLLGVLQSFWPVREDRQKRAAVFSILYSMIERV